MAEFQKVVADARRMCDVRKDCADCPLFTKDICHYNHLISIDDCGDSEKIQTIESGVEQWAAENPVKTNRDALRETFPNLPHIQNETIILTEEFLNGEYKGGVNNG